MYRPRQTNRAAMYGGDYISTINTSSLTAPDISLSSLYYIMSVASITSIDALTTLTTQQLTQLSRGIDEQIAADRKIIDDNTSTIAGIGTEINTPGGLQDIYNTAEYQYQSSLTNYNLTSTAIANAQITYRNDQSTLSSLYTISTSYVSSIKSYESEYSTIVSSLQQYASTVYMYEQQYQQALLNLSANTILCNAKNDSLSLISTSVVTGRTQLQDPSLTSQVLSTISSAYAYDLQLYNEMSTQVTQCAISGAQIQSDIAYTYYAISSILQISSFLMLEKTSYASTIAYYQGLDSVTEATIAQYMNDISSLTGQICTIKDTNSIILSGLQSEITRVGSDGAQFYSLYLQGLNAECDEYIYGIQEFNSQVGFITAALGIAINANAVQMDNYTFSLLDTSLTTANRTLINDNKTTLSNDNQAMNTVINQINTLDGQFTLIISYISNEKTKKQTFVDKRKLIFTTYELPALGYSQSQIDAVQTEYFNAFADLNTTITAINSDISNRRTTLGQIQQVTDSVKSQVNNYFQKYLFNSEDQLPNTLTRVLADDGVTPLGGSVIVPEYVPPNSLASNSQYAFIPPITF